MLRSYSGFTNVAPPINPATQNAWTVNEIFLDMLKQGPLPAAPEARFTDTSATPVWPQAPYVQPLWP